MSDRYICIHGHFYQPPREDPWLECILRQESAHPYHDWNERIASECYAPNAAARILDAQGHVARTVNNYAQISFDFGPTLLRWLETQSPETYHAILAADRQSLARFHGHGCAMAQAYSHAILPLLSRRDKVTEVRWGIADFVARFKRRPEGMWLPETAVDTETLDVLAEHGIRFTILAPHQARRIRARGSSTWREADAHDVDTSRPYTVTLSSGRSIAIFLYNGPVWRAITGEGLLHNGEQLAERLLDAFGPPRTQPQLVNVASDGEMYGHHHRSGEMALAYALHCLSGRRDVTLTNYGEFLERSPPDAELEIVEQSSWSCPHGVERWRAECGCRAGIGEDQWQQAWRPSLRNALNTLRARLDAIFVEAGRDVFHDPVEARNLYVDVVNGARSLTDLVRAPVSGTTSDETRVRTLKLLESQRYAAMMLTSCAWFFDDVSRVEPVQNLRYAARAMQLVREWADTDLEAEFVEHLAAARSNHAHIGDGRSLWHTLVQPAIVDLEDVVVDHSDREPSGMMVSRVDSFAHMP